MLQALTEHLLRSQPVLDVGEAAGWTHTERAVTPCSCQARQIHNRGAGGEKGPCELGLRPSFAAHWLCDSGAPRPLSGPPFAHL